MINQINLLFSIYYLFIIFLPFLVHSLNQANVSIFYQLFTNHIELILTEGKWFLNFY